MIRLFIYFLLFIPQLCFSCDCVILLHGLGRTHRCMLNLEKTLLENHFIVVNQDYPSTRKSIHELSENSISQMIDVCEENHADNIDFVTHSLGGIILRDYLSHHDIPHLKRIVMLAPPNHGSEIADALHKNFFYKRIFGPAAQELTTNQNSTVNGLPELTRYQVGIIAGTSTINPLGNLFFSEPNDGIVTVSSVKMDTAEDFITIPVSHTFIVRNKQVKKQILYFLINGRFS